MKTVKQDLLMFIGTRREVDKAPAINKCFYFAWDSGDFFLGNAHGSKTQYGSKKDTLSKNEIEVIVQDMVTELVSDVSYELNENNKLLLSYKASVEGAINFINSEIDKIYVDTKDYVDEIVKDRVPEFLKNYYTVNDIDSLLKNYTKSSDLAKLDEKYVLKTEAPATFIQYVEGSYIISNAYKLDGIFLSLSDYEGASTNIYKGYIYRVKNGIIEEISSGGGGGGSASPEIMSFKINNYSDVMITTSNMSLSPQSSIFYDLENSKYMESLILKYDNQTILTGLPIGEGQSTIYRDLSDLSMSIGSHVFELYGLNKNGSDTSAKIYNKVVRRILYGVGKDSIENLYPEAGIYGGLSPLDKLKTNPTGTYSYTITSENKYIWIAIPINRADAMSIDPVDITANGFVVPTIQFTKDSDYRLFRSVYELNPGTVTIKIIGTGLLD